MGQNSNININRSLGEYLTLMGNFEGFKTSAEEVTADGWKQQVKQN